MSPLNLARPSPLPCAPREQYNRCQTGERITAKRLCTRPAWGPGAALKFLQSIARIREEMEVHGKKPLVRRMVESDADRANNTEEAEFEVGVSAFYKELITLDEARLDSEVEDARGKAKLRVAVRIAALLKYLRLRTLPTGSDKGVMEEDGDSNEDDVQEDVMEMMIDLAEVSGDLLGTNAAAK